MSLILLEAILNAARHLGLWRLEAELNGERKDAVRSLQSLGFEELYCLPGYIIDMDQDTHDYVVMGMEIKTAEEYAGAF